MAISIYKHLMLKIPYTHNTNLTLNNYLLHSSNKIWVKDIYCSFFSITAYRSWQKKGEKILYIYYILFQGKFRLEFARVGVGFIELYLAFLVQWALLQLLLQQRKQGHIFRHASGWKLARLILWIAWRYHGFAKLYWKKEN